MHRPPVHTKNTEDAAVCGMHLDADTITAFAEQALTPPEQAPVFAHLAECGVCREWLAALGEVKAPLQAKSPACSRPLFAGCTAPGWLLPVAFALVLALFFGWALRPRSAVVPDSNFQESQSLQPLASSSLIFQPRTKGSPDLWPTLDLHREVRLAKLSFQSNGPLPAAVPLRREANQISLQTAMGERWVTIDPVEPAILR